METKTIQCCECKKDMSLGDDVIVVERCAVGPKRIVPLGEQEVFCSAECLKSYYNGGSKEVPERIP